MHKHQEHRRRPGMIERDLSDMAIRASHALVPFHMKPGESHHSSVQHQTDLLEWARSSGHGQQTSRKGDCQVETLVMAPFRRCPK